MARHPWIVYVGLAAACALQVPADAAQQRSTTSVSRPDFAGTWVRLRERKFFIDNGVGGSDLSRAGERLIIAQDADALTVRDGLARVTRIVIGGAGERTDTGSLTTRWETNLESGVDTLVVVTRRDTGVTVGSPGVPGSREDKDEWWLDRTGLLMNRSSTVAWPIGAEKPARSHVMMEKTYVRESLVSGITRVGLVVNLSGDSDGCGFTTQELTTAITRSSAAGSLGIDVAERVSDAPRLRISIHSARSQTPVTPPAEIVISVVRCAVSMSVEVERPTRLVYRNGREFVGSPPDIRRWTTDAVVRDVEEFAAAVKLASQRR